jgi:hypothetical protein
LATAIVDFVQVSQLKDITVSATVKINWLPALEKNAGVAAVRTHCLPVYLIAKKTTISTNQRFSSQRLPVLDSREIKYRLWSLSSGLINNGH